MKLFSARRIPNVLQIGLIIAAALVSIMAGTTYLVNDSPYSPLLVVGLVLGILLALISVRKPVLALYTALLVVLLPIGLFPASMQSNINRGLTVVALVVWGINVITQRRRIVWTSTALLMLGFLAWCLLTVLWAQNLDASKYELGGYVLRIVLFLFLIPNEINNRKTFDWLMYILAIAGWVYLIAGVVAIESQEYEFGTRMQILEANENTLGALFPVVLVGVVWLAVRPHNPHRAFWIFMSLLFILLSFILIALSGSRGGAISWFITMLVLLFWRPTRLWGIAGLVILVAAVIIVPLILSTTIERFTDRTESTPLGGREALWQAAWLLIRDHPLTGVGIGNAPRAMMSYVGAFKSTLENEEASIHNPILTIWAETGIPGTLLYLGVFISAIWSCILQHRRRKKSGPHWLMPYFALMASAFMGYFASWIKGGGIESSFSYFLMLALLLIPSHLDIND